MTGKIGYFKSLEQPYVEKQTNIILLNEVKDEDNITIFNNPDADDQCVCFR